jgi:hypothetical protein
MSIVDELNFCKSPTYVMKEVWRNSIERIGLLANPNSIVDLFHSLKIFPTDYIDLCHFFEYKIKIMYEIFVIYHPHELVKNIIAIPPSKIVKIEIKNSCLRIFNVIDINLQTVLDNFNVDNYETVEALTKSICTLLEKFITQQERANKRMKVNLDRIKEKEEHVERIKSIFERLTSTECPICLDDMERKTLLLCCLNVACLDSLRQCDKCPFCREPIQGKLPFDSSLQAKHERLLELSFPQDSKLIIYTGTNISKDKLEEYRQSWFPNSNPVLSLYNLTSIGIEKVLDSFENNPKNNMLYLDESKCMGLNLQYVDAIVVLDSSRDNIIKQLIGRAERIGRTKPLTIYYVEYEKL